MREGFDNDDIYVMVEDEFLATASMFTRHLHEAEYARRKKQARMKNATAVSGIARPTDAKSEMSVERKMNTKAKIAWTKQKTALDQIKNDTGSSAVDGYVEDEDDDADDPWIGTQLQALMTSPRKSRSLVGPQGVKSTTRAALGYSGASSHAAPRATSQTVIQEDRHTSSRHAEQSITIDEDTSSGDDDDLGIPRKPKTVKAETSPSSVVPGSRNALYESPKSSRKKSPETSNEVTKPASSRPAARANAKPSYTSRMDKFFDDSDDSPGPKVKPESPLPKRGVPKRSAPVSSRDRLRQQEQKSRKDRLNQVPTFL